MRRTALILCTILLAAAAAFLPAASASAAPGNGPVQDSFVTAAAYGLLNPDVAPSGSNDWTCRPTAAHPRPVVLVHGTWANQYNSWAFLAPRLKAAGYCVFSLNYGRDTSTPVGSGPGVDATGPIMDSAREVGAFTERVRAATGAAKVDLVGYSQGGIVVRGYLKFFGGANAADPAANHVQNVVTYAATNHGTTMDGMTTLASALHTLGLVTDVVGASAGAAATDQVVGSDYVTALNAGGDTMPGIDYTILTTKYDEVSTPYRASFLTAGPGATVKNIVIQDGCAIDGSEHLAIPFSLRAADYTLKALDPGTPRTIRCAPELPVL